MRSTRLRSRALPRTGGNGGIIIAYLNGKLPAFVDTYVSVVDIQDCVEGHLLAAERGESGQRYVLNGATLPSLEALEIVSELSGRARPRADGSAAGGARGGCAGRGRVPPAREDTLRSAAPACGRSCTATATTARGRRRELGLDYTPVADTFARTIEWAVAEGLVTRPLPGAQRAGP